jgi:hypothetical protein
MLSRTIVLGFHGCDLALARAVASGSGELHKSENAYDWLGHGVYFWEDSPERAIRWADEHRRHPAKIKTPAALGAVISLGNCLNLIEAEATSMVRAAYVGYRQLCQTSGEAEARNGGPGFGARFLDCAVFETLHRLRESEGAAAFATVRGFFVEGTELYPGAGIRDRDHIQICVRDPKQILGYFLPRRP